MRGRDNGIYLYKYKEMIYNFFGAGTKGIEVCSNSIVDDNGLTTVDIRPDVNPNYVVAGQDMSTIFEDETFDRWYCDPPCNEVNALKMYDTSMPSRQKLIERRCQSH